MRLETLLSAALRASCGLSAEAMFGDAIYDIKDRPSNAMASRRSE
jgi:hypothetical protein